MKKVVTIIGCFVYCLSIASAQKVDTNFHIYLLVGQSNMAGRGLIDSISKETNAQIVMLDKNNNWVPATDPVHFDSLLLLVLGLPLVLPRKWLGATK